MAVPDVDHSAGRGPTDRLAGRSTAAAGPMPIRLSEAMLRPLKTSEIIARDIVGDIARHRLVTGTNVPHLPRLALTNTFKDVGSGVPGGQQRKADAVLRLLGTASRQDDTARANQVSVLGISSEHFFGNTVQ